MSLHIDDLSWRVNKLRELDRMRLEDPTDVAMWPGKTVFRSHDVPQGEPVVKEVYTSPSTSETLATLQHWDQRRENSSFVNQFVAGQRGTRTQITKGEVDIKTGQSMTIFDSIGEDIEEGAVYALKAAVEILTLNWSEYSNPTVNRIMANNPNAEAFAKMDIEAKKELLRANCDIKILGISAQIKNSELIPRLQWMMSKAVEGPFAKYFKPYKLLKRSVNVLGFYEPDFIDTDEEAKAKDEAEMAARVAGGAEGGAGGVALPPEVAGQAGLASSIEGAAPPGPVGE